MEFKNKLEKAGEDGTLYLENADGYTCEKLRNYKEGDILYETIYKTC